MFYLLGMRRFLLFLLLSAAVRPVFAFSIRDTALLRQEGMAVYAAQPQASFALAVEDLQTGEQFFINERESFHAASTMKTPVLIETFRQVARHRLSLDDSLLIHTDFLSIADSS